MARWTRYILPHGVRRLGRPIFSEAKLFARVWLNVLLPWRLLRYRRIINQPIQNVHFGCGSRLFPGWTNVDMNKKGDFTADLREGLPFRDESVQLMYSEHTLEHFYREHDGPWLLRECLRCLVPGGTLRITIPDAAAYIAYYTGDLEDEETAADMKSTHSRFHGTRMDVVNSAFRWKHQHFYMYDAETMTKLLEEIGFVDVERRDFASSSVPELESVDAPMRRFGTLYMEGRKAQQPPAS
ncbi:MAG: methyltransferase domain-containing protein [Planctomycetota bacterium]